MDLFNSVANELTKHNKKYKVYNLEFNSRIFVAEEAFNNKKTDFTSKLDLI